MLQKELIKVKKLCEVIRYPESLNSTLAPGVNCEGEQIGRHEILHLLRCQLRVTKDTFPRMSSSEMVGPGDTAVAVAVSTERLRQRLQQEGVSEAAIADSESIMRAEFEALQKQALPLLTPQDFKNSRVTQAMDGSFFSMSLNEWRDLLRDINFWLDGYCNTPAYWDLTKRLSGYSFRYNVQWNLGVGATACFARAISRITRDGLIRTSGPFNPVIEVDMKHEAVVGMSRLGIIAKLAIKVAEQLGLLGQEYHRLKADVEEVLYYTYGLHIYGLRNATDELERLTTSLVSQIFQILTPKRYLVVVENLDEPIIQDIYFILCLPPPPLQHSSWLISATSQDVYNRSELNYYSNTMVPYSGDDMVVLTLYSLHQAAKYILGAIGGRKDDEQYWHHMAIRCFHYATMLLVPHYHSSSCQGDDGGQQSSASGLADDIVSDELLIRQWSAQGFLVLNDTKRTTGSGSSYDGNYSDIYQVGNVILEAFREYSLLPQLPFSLSPATTEKAEEEATKSAAHFLAYHNLIMEHHTIDELCEGDHPWLERMQWISHVGGQGWHSSREWLNHGASGPTTLILRHCSQHSRLLAKLNYLLAKLPHLCVLDLSYSSVESLPPSISCLQRLQLLYLSHTPLKSLPPSIFCLQKLQFISLRGCYNITSPFSFSDTDIITLLENNSNTEISVLHHLDLSYTNIKTFHSDFFHRMPNLQELLLLKCSNLEQLPPSTAALSSLEKVELRGTQMKSFPGKMFENMKKLGSVKIIENKELLFSPAGLFSKASGLTDLHIEGYESITEVEISLEGHPTLRSFSFIGAPHVKQLSLRGCRKLEYVDIDKMGALEELDLSATAIKELPDSIPNLPHLRRLLLMGVPSLRRFPWHRLERLPDVFCLDQCSSSRAINHSDQPQVAHQVCIISDSRLFYSFNDDTMELVRAGELLKAFYVQVTSCKATTRKMQDGEDMVTTNTPEVAPAAYADVNRWYLTAGLSMVSMDDVPPFREAVRHVEISAADRYPHGMDYLLRVTKSLSMWDDTLVSCLSDLSGNLDELEECKLRWCHKAVHVFKSNEILNLKNASFSHLKSLTHFHYNPWGISSSYFSSLKHLVLEDCPRLECVMEGYCELLRSLETLDILYCYSLKSIFDNTYQLPCLRRIHLQELPLLEHFYKYDSILTAPAWEELHVRGCWSLHRLPRLRRQPDKKAAVKVSGERAWWAKLIWDQEQDNDAPLIPPPPPPLIPPPPPPPPQLIWDQEEDDDDDDDASPHRGSYEPRLAPEFASHRERVIIKSYLR